jgi:hypothetical protein
MSFPVLVITSEKLEGFYFQSNGPPTRSAHDNDLTGRSFDEQHPQKPYFTDELSIWF